MPMHTSGSESAWAQMAREQEWMQLQQQRQLDQQEFVRKQAAEEEKRKMEEEAKKTAAEAAALQLEAKAKRKAEREARRKEEAEKEQMRQLEEEALQRERGIAEAKRKQEEAAAARAREREARNKDREMAEAPQPGEMQDEDVDLSKLKTKGQIYAHYLKMEKKKLKAEQDLHKRELEKASDISLDKLRFFSPLAAQKMEEDARAKQAEADDRAQKRIAATARRERLMKRRLEREGQEKEKHEQALKEIQEKQAEEQEKKIALLAEQLRLDHEARTRAEERESKQMRKLKGKEGPKKDAPLRRVIRDEDKLRQLFTSISSLPAYGPRRAYCAGELCRVDDERGDGTVLLRFEDGFVSWFPKRGLIGFEDADAEQGVLAVTAGPSKSTKPETVHCDVCNKVCVPTPATRARVCGDRETVYKIYVQMWEQGGLPPWNPRNVPNPRRAYCPGAECNIEEEDKASGKVKLRFDDDFVTWFPALTLQGRKTQMEKEQQILNPVTSAKCDPFGWNECMPDVAAITQPTQGLIPESGGSSFNKAPMNPSQADFSRMAAAAVPMLRGPGEA